MPYERPPDLADYRLLHTFGAPLATRVTLRLALADRRQLVITYFQEGFGPDYFADPVYLNPLGAEPAAPVSAEYPTRVRANETTFDRYVVTRSSEALATNAFRGAGDPQPDGSYLFWATSDISFPPTTVEVFEWQPQPPAPGHEPEPLFPWPECDPAPHPPWPYGGELLIGIPRAGARRL